MLVEELVPVMKEYGRSTQHVAPRIDFQQLVVPSVTGAGGGAGACDGGVWAEPAHQGQTLGPAQPAGHQRSSRWNVVTNMTVYTGYGLLYNLLGGHQRYLCLKSMRARPAGQGPSRWSVTRTLIVWTIAQAP